VQAYSYGDVVECTWLLPNCGHGRKSRGQDAVVDAMAEIRHNLGVGSEKRGP